MKAIEIIRDGENVLATILRSDYEPAGIEFLTAPDQPLQLGVMLRPTGYEIRPHLHHPVHRSIEQTYEALFITRGTLEVTFFNDHRESVAIRTLSRGDCVILQRGGHGFRVLDDCRIVEVKQGPFVATEVDKSRF